MSMKKEKANELAKSDPLYHNTFKLLKNYRDVVWSVESSVVKAQMMFRKEWGSDIEDFLDMAYCAGINIGDSKVESHIKSIERSRNMLKIVDIAVETLRTKHKNGEKYYWILYYSYLSPQELPYSDDIIDSVRTHCRDVSRRTFYRQRNDAINHLSSVLWGYTSHECMDLADMFASDEEK